MKRAIWIAVSVAVVAAVVAGGFWLWTYLESRPRVYADARADALTALAQEVGLGALDRGVFGVPESIALPGRCAAFADGFFVSLNGRESLLYAPPPRASLEAVPGTSWKLARLDEAQARRILAALTYLSAAYGKGMPDNQRLPSIHPAGSACPVLQVYGGRGSRTVVWSSPDRPPIAAEAGARAAARYIAGIAAKARFLDNPSDVGALARASLASALPVASPAQEAIAGRAVAWLGDYPDASALELLKKTARLRAERGKPSKTRDWPLVGRYLANDDRYSPPATADAVWCTENLAGKSGAAQREFVMGILSDAKSDDAAARRASRFFARHWPGEFAQFVAARWEQMTPARRIDCLYLCSDSGADLANIGKLVIADSDRDVRMRGAAVLCRRTGDGRYARAFLTDLGTLTGLDEAKTMQWDRNCREICGVYMEHRDLVEIPAYFARMVSAMPQNDKAWAALGHRVPEGDEGMAMAIADMVLTAVAAQHGDRSWVDDPAAVSPSFAVASVLAAAGGRENVGALMRMFEHYGEKPAGVVGGATEVVGDWPPCLTLSTRRALAESTDSVLADAMLEYVKLQSPRCDGRICAAFLDALAVRGDERLAPVLQADIVMQHRTTGSPREVADRRRSLDIIYSGGMAWADEAIPEVRLEWLLMTISLRRAEDPLTLLAESDANDVQMVQDAASQVLAAKYTVPQLEAFLADARYSGVCGPVYMALVQCRAQEQQRGLVRLQSIRCVWP